MVLGGPGFQPDAQSGAGVWLARTAAGDDAYLKVTAAPPGPGDLAAARRELRVYRDLSPTLPVRTPPLLGAQDSEAGVAVLLGAVGAARPAAEWTEAMWAAVGAALGRLHNIPAPTGAEWAREDSTTAALDHPDQWAVDAFWGGKLADLERIVADGPNLRAAAGVFAPVFVHGDCHAGNVLYDDGAPVFCDWQSAGVGRPASDLAFFSVRATPSGTVVPSGLVEAYLRERRCDRLALHRAMVAEELLVFVFRWPEYAPFNTPPQIARVVRRTRELARIWFAAEQEDAS